MCHHSGKERPSLRLPGSYTEAESTRHSDSTSALSPQSCPSGEQAAASGDGHGHLASPCFVQCEGSGGKSHVSPAAFRMHLPIVSELGPRPGAKGICQAHERRVKRQSWTQVCLLRKSGLCQSWVEGLGVGAGRVPAWASPCLGRSHWFSSIEC